MQNAKCKMSGLRQVKILWIFTMKYLLRKCEIADAVKYCLRNVKCFLTETLWVCDAII